jgi:hypothetical protein
MVPAGLDAAYCGEEPGSEMLELNVARVVLKISMRATSLEPELGTYIFDPFGVIAGVTGEL